MSNKPTPAAIILEKARREYPEAGIVVLVQNNELHLDFTSNVIPEDLEVLLTQALSAVRKMKLLEKPEI
jgi:hypothetical protein